MESRYEEYESFAKKLISRTGIMKTGQLLLSLQNTFPDMDEALADAVLKSCQRRRILFLSENGYAVTIGTYIMASGDRFLDDIDFDGDCRIRDIRLERTLVSRDVIDAMWIAADMMPDSMDFMISAKPWILQFVTPETEGQPSCLYQVAKISAGREIPETVLLEEAPPVRDPDMRRQIRRIALLDRPDEAFRIPCTGFSHICLLDEKAPSGFRVIAKRGGQEAWADYD